LNSPPKSDEVIVFQGASYFRALARGQRYGLSARALAIGTASPGGEEFPEFREFWIEKPAPGERSISIYGLLDSPSTSGAYRFRVHPGTTTQVEVEATIYPRREIADIGIAPLTSMFMLGPIDRDRVGDFRPQVHDSDGLAILNGNGERLWRPLANPEILQVSAFIDDNNKGFGLIQRERSFSRYEDLEARYDLRPSAWVEPLSEFGKGSVTLVEIPTEKEIHDNIVSFWRPASPIPAGRPYSFRYRLHWREDTPTKELGAYVVSTRAGNAHFAKGEGTKLLFVIDYNFSSKRVGGKVPAAKVTTSQGRVQNIVLRENPENGGLRVSFEFFPEGAKTSELRLDLVGLPNRAAESWLYRWTSTS
ncbi:MAG: glucan biosynthesis protein, partial [Hyphomicrobiaceae bacterium]